MVKWKWLMITDLMLFDTHLAFDLCPSQVFLLVVAEDLLESKGYVLFTSSIPPSGVVGNMLAMRAVNTGSIPGLGIHSDSDDYYNGGPVTLDSQWHVKEPWRR